VKDRNNLGELTIKYCSNHKFLADFCTKTYIKSLWTRIGMTTPGTLRTIMITIECWEKFEMMVLIRKTLWNYPKQSGEPESNEGR